MLHVSRIPCNNDLWLQCVPIGTAYPWLTILPLAKWDRIGYKVYAVAYGLTDGWMDGGLRG